MTENKYIDEYNTIEKALALFNSVNGCGEYNNIFVSFIDMRVISEGPRPDGYLINQTEKGLGMFFLHDTGYAWTSQNINRLRIDKGQYIFISREDIKSITIKNYNFINSKVKKVRIVLIGGYVFDLMIRLVEKDIPYHEENFNKFINSYK